MQRITKSAVRGLLLAAVLSALVGGALAATDDSGTNGPSETAPAATAAQNQPRAGDFGRADRRDMRRGGHQDGGPGAWRHRGWHRMWYRRGWYRGGPAILVRPGFGPPPFMMHRRFRGHGRGGMAGFGGPGMFAHPLVGIFRRLNLTADQRQRVRTILMHAHQQAAAQRRRAGAAPDFTALINPGDPNHARAVQAAQDRAQQRIQQASQTEQNLYDVLTAQQKSQLTQMFAQMRARTQQRAAHRQPQAAPRPQGEAGP